MNRISSVSHVYLVSDSTGETAQSVAQACLALFPEQRTEIHLTSQLLTENQIEKLLAEIQESPGVVLFTLVGEELRDVLIQRCRELEIPAVSILEPVISLFSGLFGQEPSKKPGLRHEMGEAYFSRIHAMEFVLNHDDGRNIEDMIHADVILIGVSRSSKTPTCLYLANQGIKAANIPFVGHMEITETLQDMIAAKTPKIFGLIKDGGDLLQIRKSRMVSVNYDRLSHYTDPEAISEELRLSRRFFAENRIPIIDVTHRSIEETATEIMSRLARE